MWEKREKNKEDELGHERTMQSKLPLSSRNSRSWALNFAFILSFPVSFPSPFKTTKALETYINRLQTMQASIYSLSHQTSGLLASTPLFILTSYNLL